MQQLLIEFGVKVDGKTIWAAWYYWNHTPPSPIESITLDTIKATAEHVYNYRWIYGKPTKVKPFSK